MKADVTGMDLLEAQTSITVSTTAYAWENFGLWSRSDSEDYGAQLLIVYEAPEYVKEELAEADAKLEQKAIGRDALVFIVNEENPVQSLTQQQLRDIYAGRITSWKDVGGADAPIVAFQRGVDSGSQTLFKKLLIDKGDGQLMAAPTELARRHGRPRGQHRRVQQLRQRHRLFGLLLHRPDVLEARPPSAGRGRRDPRQ